MVSKETEFCRCNQCGKRIKTGGLPPYEEGLSVEKHWGYFSEKDGEIHRFFLCEACYDRLLEGFSIPVEPEEEIELV